MITPLDAIAGNEAQAKLIIKSSNAKIPLRFNPTEYQIQKQNIYAEVAIPGLDAPPLQFVRGGAARLTVDVLVDTSDTLADVRTRYLDQIDSLLKVESESHAPPIVAFHWDREVFSGVLEQATTTFLLFTDQGVPVRAKVSLAIKQHAPVEVQVNQARTASPNFDKAYTVRRGDTLTSIAAATYQDATAWRAIALANNIQDPRRLVPGTVLALPRLR